MEHHRPLESRAKLADVPGPGVCHQELHRVRPDPAGPETVPAGDQVDEAQGQVGNVLGVISKWRDSDLHDVKAVVEIFPEATLATLHHQVLIRGRHHPHVDLPRLLAPDPVNLSQLDGPKQLRLRGGAQVADLVQE